LSQFQQEVIIGFWENLRKSFVGMNLRQGDFMLPHVEITYNNNSTNQAIIK